MARLHQNRTSWRERPRAGSYGPAGLSFGGSPAPCEGLQNQTHAALQQLRGELKSLSVRSMHGSAAAVVAPAASAAALPFVAAATGGGSGGGHPVVAGIGNGPVDYGAGGSSGGGGDGAFSESGLSGGASGGGVGSPTPGYGRHSEGQAQQLSPSRLSASCSNYYNSGDECGAGRNGAGVPTEPQIFPHYQALPHSGGLGNRAPLTATAAAVHSAVVAHTEARVRA
ncbi:hypothetical protein Vretimale_15958 [Volvox reticuliferus]|nr:hypothetical protein Vretimale_15958 [Volvox reticuliferus]